MLARCRSRNITQYYASVLLPGSTELMIVMELMAASVFDAVRPCRAALFMCCCCCCCWLLQAVLQQTEKAGLHRAVPAASSSASSSKPH